MDNYGFIITRHVNNERTNKYWNNSVACIRRLYPDTKIVIIDDNSNMDLVKSFQEYKNVEVVESEFKGRGELLPYYYFHKNRYFQNAVIIHDSVFIHKRIDFNRFAGCKVIPLWHFAPDKEHFQNTQNIVRNLKNRSVLYNKLSMMDQSTMLWKKNHEKWFGCFGVQSYINYEFLDHIQKKYDLFKALDTVKCRMDRCALERIFGAIFFNECKGLHKYTSLFGSIHTYMKWGYTYEEYEKNVSERNIPRSVVKVWTGR
jgi:hypothetical protein